MNSDIDVSSCAKSCKCGSMNMEVCICLRNPTFKMHTEFLGVPGLWEKDQHEGFHLSTLCTTVPLQKEGGLIMLLSYNAIWCALPICDFSYSSQFVIEYCMISILPTLLYIYLWCRIIRGHAGNVNNVTFG